MTLYTDLVWAHSDWYWLCTYIFTCISYCTSWNRDQ